MFYTRTYDINLELATEEVAEWLRRLTANPMFFAHVGSNPILVVNIYIFSSAYAKCFAEMVNIRLTFFALVAQNFFKFRIFQMTIILEVN